MSLRRLFILTALTGLAGCASKPIAPPTADSGPHHAPTLGDRLTHADNGLELRRWTIDDPAHRMSAIMGRWIDEQHAEDLTDPRLRRNGVRLVRISPDDLDSMLSDLGGVNVEHSEWHGQIHDWRTVSSRPLGRTGRALAVDGRIRRLDRGELRLMIRSWTAQMETGPAIHLEVLPRHDDPQPRTLKQLLGAETPERGEGFPGLAIDMQLESDWAYIMTGESPQTDWEPEPPAGGGGRNSTRVGPLDPAGPDAAAPPTIGEFVMGVEEHVSRRLLLVFVPRIPQELRLPEPAQDPSVGITARLSAS